MRLAQELESSEFYLTQGYTDLAAKNLDALENEFGSRQEIIALRQRFADVLAAAPTNVVETEMFSAEILPAADSPPAEIAATELSNGANGYHNFTDFRADLGLEEVEQSGDAEDYETHYQFAVAYQEMGLTEDAIREFQEAVGLVAANDGTRRFFQCANLLGHCFMEKQMPNLALIWFKRSLETANLSELERHGLLYELGNASEIGGDFEKAAEYFEQIYAVEVNYRNVAKRLESLREHNFLQD